MGRSLSLLLLVATLGLVGAAGPPSALAASPNIVISQVYGGAGCGTAGCSTYQNDYIELFNRGTSAVIVNGWSVQYAAATGTAWQVTNLPNSSIAAGQYFLVAESFGATGVNPLPTPDVSGTIAMSATAAKVAVVNMTTALTGACPTGSQIVDFVGYGATANCAETAAAPAPSTTLADVRAAAGCTDTDDNSTDFTAAAPTPRNTASPLNPCPPTAVGVRSFSAERTPGAVLLKWRTASETGLLGFNLYREQAGQRVRMNASTIRALAPGSAVGHLYSWRYRPAGAASRYWLQVVRLDGSRAWRGPVTPTRS